MTEEILVNKVSQSGLITLNLEDYFPQDQSVEIDIKEALYMGLVLKEKDFRNWVKEKNWQEYVNKNVAIHCSTDAIVPTWAYMLIASKLSGVAKKIVFGNIQALDSVLWEEAFSNIDLTNFDNQKVVIKGCGNLPVSAAAYTKITELLIPRVQSLMYGEPCSTVPVYKRKN